MRLLDWSTGVLAFHRSWYFLHQKSRYNAPHVGLLRGVSCVNVNLPASAKVQLCIAQDISLGTPARPALVIYRPDEISMLG